MDVSREKDIYLFAFDKSEYLLIQDYSDINNTKVTGYFFYSIIIYLLVAG
jgi:hypothetical protein